ncbi:hypothetical protein PAHAL_2G141300 [Panicum hallii]|uniref:Uncharacterized protein n=1 Tax=Panicum hallii TaxID=206008 RepID=A0A2T8KP11_9POAL|nr:hypothetical protein PAHAL_2G141300 [Panicum hallii]
MNRAEAIRSLPRRAGSGKNLFPLVPFRSCFLSQPAPPVRWSMELGRLSMPARRSLAVGARQDIDSRHPRARTAAGGPFAAPEARAAAKLDSRPPGGRTAAGGRFVAPGAHAAAGARPGLKSRHPRARTAAGGRFAAPGTHGRRRSIRGPPALAQSPGARMAVDSRRRSSLERYQTDCFGEQERREREYPGARSRAGGADCERCQTRVSL